MFPYAIIHRRAAIGDPYFWLMFVARIDPGLSNLFRENGSPAYMHTNTHIPACTRTENSQTHKWIQRSIKSCGIAKQFGSDWLSQKMLFQETFHSTKKEKRKESTAWRGKVERRTVHAAGESFSDLCLCLKLKNYVIVLSLSMYSEVQIT